MALGREIAHIEDRVTGLFLSVDKPKIESDLKIREKEKYETEKLV